MRALIAPLRVLALLAHILIGLAIALAIFPWQSQRRRNPTIRVWSRVLLAICGMRLRVAGAALDPELARSGTVDWAPGRLLIANHISWIDVFAILATLPGRFVAKSEIRRWPLLGWLVSLVGTLYIERGRRHAVAAINHRVRDHLKAGEVIAVFPEGTTTDGAELLPFHSNLIAPALEIGCDVWPVALRYTERGAPSRAPAFIGAMGLVTSLWNILVARDLAVEVALLPPIGTTADRSRHHVAHAAQYAIASHLGVAMPPHRRGVRPSARGTADSRPESATDPASASR
jgi:1-acyl-sn-glycerol-3-phosphate acyltransferase